MKKIAAALFCLALVLSATKQLRAQSYVYATGNPTFSTQIPIENGFINVNNGEIHIEIPLAQHAQRGRLQLNERLIYDSRIWKIIQNGGYSWSPTNVVGSMGGWKFYSGIESGSVAYSTQVNTVPYPDGNLTYFTYWDFVWTDPQGTQHAFPNVQTETCDANTTPSSCAENEANLYNKPNSNGVASDGSGYYISVTNYDQVVITDRQGNQYNPAGAPTGLSQVTDANGNYWSLDANGNLVDTLGRTPVLVTKNGNQIYYDVLTYNGARSRYTVTTETINYKTAFGQEAVNETSGSFTAIQSIQLPDGSKFSFGYDSGASAGNYGELTSVTLPAGGVIQYSYSNFLDSFQNENRWIHTRIKDGGTTTFTPATVSNCSSSAGCQEKTTITSPAVNSPTGNDTVYTFTLDNGSIANAASWNTGIDAYQGSSGTGSKLKSVNTLYTYSTSQIVLGTTPVGTYQSPSMITSHTVLPDVGLTSQTQTALDSIGDTEYVNEWDYYPSSGNAPSTPTRQTNYASGVTGYFFCDGVPAQTTVEDGVGNVISKTINSFDQTQPTPTSGLPQHSSINGQRCNLTTVSQTIDSSGAALTTTNVYDDAGTLLNSTSPNGKTSYGYDSTDTFATSTTPPTPSSGVTLVTSAQYDFSTGLLNNSTDPNGTQTVYKNYDDFGRYGEIDINDSGGNAVGKTVYTYSSPILVYVQPYQSGSQGGTTATQLDGYGRTGRVAVYNGQSWYQQDTCYDANGNVHFQSYSYQGTGFNQAKICSGSGDTYTYDALGRNTQVAHADGSSINVSYTGRATKVADENGVAKISQVDGLGRTTKICEVSAATLQGVAPVACGADIAGNGFITNYTYNRLNVETTITQGVQSRIFMNDWVGRPTSSQEPERGQTTYTYNYNSTGLIVTRQRPRENQTSANVYTITTTQYDALGRVVGITYNDGTAPKTFSYDSPVIQSSNNDVKGRLSVAVMFPQGATAGVATAYAYDAMGNKIKLEECTPSSCGTQTSAYNLSYTYDWLGNMKSSTDASGVTATYNYSLANEVSSITTSFSDSTHPGTIISNVQNGPNGPLSYQFGNGVGQSFSYDGLGRRNGGWTCTNSSQNYCPGGTSLYGWFATWQGSRLTSSADTSLNQGASYGYDDFNRLTSRTITTGAAQNYTYTYDLYGNRWAQTPLNGGNSSSLSFNATTNQVNTAGFAYDAAGNMTADGTGNQYSYDAEGNLIQEVAPTGTMKFTYDALNRQIRTDVPAFNVATENIFNSSGQLDTVWEVGTGRIIGKTYWGSTPVQSYDTGTNMAFFQHRDWNGSERLITNASGAVTDVQVSLPFGDGFANTSGARDNSYDGYDGYWDGTTNITNHTQYREYANNQGRWLQPDPYDGSYDFSNPQSFNRYAYVMNNPLTFNDPTGLQNCPPDDPCIGDDGGENDVTGLLSDIGSAIASLFGFGGPSFHGSLTPRPNGELGNGTFGSDGVFYPDTPYTISTGTYDFNGYFPAIAVVAAAPNSGLNGVGPNPCSGANPANLNYQAVNPYNKGADTAFNHIFQNHILGGPGKSVYAGGPGGTAGAVGNMFRLNALTLVQGTLVQPSVGGIAVLSYYEAPGSFGPFSWGHVGTSNGQTTQYHTLVVKNCTVPQTSYPGLPSSYQP